MQLRRNSEGQHAPTKPLEDVIGGDTNRDPALKVLDGFDRDLRHDQSG